MLNRFITPAFYLFLLCPALTRPHAAVAEPIVQPHAQVELIADQNSIQPGRAFRLGLRFKLDPGWHIYWLNPGDTGLPTKLTWELPKGFTPGELLWPVPHRIPLGPQVNFGYEDELLLSASVQAPDNLFPGSHVQLKARASWLVCEKTCVPGKAELTLTLPVSADSPRPSVQSDAFIRLERQLPVSPPKHWRLAARVVSDSSRLVLKVSGAGSLSKNSFFFPKEAKAFNHSTPQKVRFVKSGTEIQLETAKEFSSKGITELQGVLRVGEKGYWIEASLSGAGVNEPLSGSSLVQLFPTFSMGALGAIVFAFLGGLLLNLMPCVFPVLSLKVIRLIHQPGIALSRFNQILEAVAYTFGIFVSFWTFAVVMLILRTGGKSLGWGFQLQSPEFVGLLALLFFFLSLNLFGVFELGSRFMGFGSSFAVQRGRVGAFFTGVLTAVVATPCTAPFMGTALGYALTQSWMVVLLIFSALALGLAFPLLLILTLPSIGRFMPKPGRWMETFRQALSFPLLAAMIWLIWVFGLQTDFESVIRLLVALLGVGIASWTLGKWQTRAALIASSATLMLAAYLVLGFVPKEAPAHALHTQATRILESPNGGTIAWQPYTEASLKQLLESKKPVFLNFTAAWCVTCKFNEQLTFKDRRVVQAFQDRGIVPLLGDWTKEDPKITQALAQFGRQGVPLYVLYSGKSSERPPRVLPQLLTPQIMLKELKGVQ